MSRAHILVIDDEPRMLRALESILTPDHHVTCSAAVLDAVELAARVKPDLVICDISMPRADGFQLMQKLKSAQPDVDVILMTGLADPEAHMVRAIREGAFYFIVKPFDRNVMLTLVERSLELRRLRQEVQSYVQRVGRELSDARVLQQTMLPEPRALIEGVNIAARYEACSELGGDMYDYAAVGPGRAAVMVADVAGHGVSAAMLTAVVKSAFGSSVAHQFEPRSVIRRIARDIAHFSARRFVTLFVACIDRNARTLEFACAGHPPALFWDSAASIRMLDATGPLISPAFGDDEWDQQTTTFELGSRLLLYTDGITEAIGDAGQFSRQRLIEQIARDSTRADDELLSNILDAVHTHCGRRPQHDDLTLLAASV